MQARKDGTENGSPSGEVPNTESLDSTVFSPITLPCGRVVANRLVKVAMYEHLAAFNGGPPNRHHFALYAQWARYGWGMVITGNVQVSRSHLTLGRDMVIPEVLTEDSMQPFKTLAAAILSSDSEAPLALMQLSHAGRQSPNFIGGRSRFARPLGPSAVPVRPRGVVNWALFRTAKPMSVEEVEDVVQAFVRGAMLALDAGFHGVQLHVAHGYLLAQFLSLKSNTRTDEYAATPDRALHLLRRIVLSIRAKVPEEFILGIKLNAADYVDRDTPTAEELEGEKRSLEHVRAIASWGCIDFIEISGGDYENPEFMQTAPLSKVSARQAFFARFSVQALRSLDDLPKPTPLILLTGGLRTPAHLHTVLVARHAHLLGIGRGSVLRPDLPHALRDCTSDDASPFAREPHVAGGYRWIRAMLPRNPLIGAGFGVAWYVVAMRRIAASGLEAVERYLKTGGVASVFRMFLWSSG